MYTCGPRYGLEIRHATRASDRRCRSQGSNLTPDEHHGRRSCRSAGMWTARRCAANSACFSPVKQGRLRSSHSANTGNELITSGAATMASRASFNLMSCDYTPACVAGTLARCHGQRPLTTACRLAALSCAVGMLQHGRLDATCSTHRNSSLRATVISTAPCGRFLSRTGEHSFGRHFAGESYPYLTTCPT